MIKLRQLAKTQLEAQLETKQGQPPLPINADVLTLISDRYKDSEE